MKNAGVTALAVIILYALQTSILPLIAYHGVTADLMLLFVTSTAFLKGVRVGALSGFAVGVLQDGESYIDRLTQKWFVDYKPAAQ